MALVCNMIYQHKPVLLSEVATALNLKNGDVVIDGTLGGGGYTMEFSSLVGKTGRVLSIDADELALNNFRQIQKTKGFDNVKIIKGNFRDMFDLVKPDVGTGLVAAIALDLGLSSAQLDDLNRGFAFSTDGPLDMSFDSNGIKTRQVVNKFSEAELIKIFRNYGEEPMASRIAKAIVVARRKSSIESSGRLVEIIGESLPAAYKARSRNHFATRVFQAIRIATNHELQALAEVLPQALRLLKPGGRLAVVSFHSLEDRIVKNFIKQESKDCICPPMVPVCVCGHLARLKNLTKKPVIANEDEIKLNPRARSAKLRVAEKLN